MKHNTILITAILSIVVLTLSVFMNSREVVGVENHDDVNTISLLESQDCEIVHTENYVCQAQRGRIDPRVMAPLVHNYNRNPSDWNCFWIIVAGVAIVISGAMANKQNQ